MDPDSHNPTRPASSPGTRIPPPHGYALSGKIMLSAIVVLFTVVLLILFIHLYVRWHVYRRDSLRRRRRQRNPLVFAGDLAGGPSPSAKAPCGLDPSVLKSLHVSIFSSEDDDEADLAAECAVCLNEFEDGEKVRLLPRCGHRFHIECIDMWFGSHNNCPLCRSPVEAKLPPQSKPESESSPPPAPAASQQCAARSSESSSDSAGPDVRVEIGEPEAGLGFSPFGSEPASEQKSRILAITRFLLGDLRSTRREPDLERGEGAETDPPPAAAADRTGL